MNNLLSRNKILGAVVIGLVLCVGAVLLFSGFFRGGSNNVPVTGDQQSRGTIGNMFVARSVDNQGCPTEQTTQFDPQDSIFVGFNQSQIPQGTSMFARLSQDGQPIEDTDEITADRDTNSCVWFEFSPTGGSGFAPGEYQAEMFVNGNPAGRASLTVMRVGGGLLPGDSSTTNNTGLGQAYTTTQVDNNGCPTDDATTFAYNEPIFVAFQESSIPAGTEIFARLNYQGDPVEDTDPIVAERDMQACFWFVFEPDSGGFTEGAYTIDVFVNGNRAESLPVEVR